MTGIILRLAIPEGKEVKPGDTILVMEAIKMELPIKTTVPGKVHFLVAPDTQVVSQQPIAQIG
jgi:biotin carboxyl carrier protein